MSKSYEDTPLSVKVFCVRCLGYEFMRQIDHTKPNAGVRCESCGNTQFARIAEDITKRRVIDVPFLK